MVRKQPHGECELNSTITLIYYIQLCGLKEREGFTYVVILDLGSGKGIPPLHDVVAPRCYSEKCIRGGRGSTML